MLEQQVALAMIDKQRELTQKQTQESLEEFFTLLSFHSQYDRLQILAIETVEQAALTDAAQPYKAEVIQLADKRQQRQPQRLSKALQFQDQFYLS